MKIYGTWLIPLHNGLNPMIPQVLVPLLNKVTFVTYLMDQSNQVVLSSMIVVKDVG
jgi:hypothetical protein